MAFDLKRSERTARATASDTAVYHKDEILKSFEEDNFFEALAENMEESKKAFVTRCGAEAAATNILERAINDTIFVPLGEQGKYPIF
ncbi:MAG: hypothetical protein J6A01_02510 [Proteobacteria bacterium]|nr:hypothetical protein [Pseudomonadota bacterium]